MNNDEKKILSYLKENLTSQSCFKAADLQELFEDENILIQHITN